jgi:hypothetical protein
MACSRSMRCRQMSARVVDREELGRLDQDAAADQRSADGRLVAGIGDGRVRVEPVGDSGPLGVQLVAVVDEELEERWQPLFTLDHPSDGDRVAAVKSCPGGCLVWPRVLTGGTDPA